MIPLRRSLALLVPVAFLLASPAPGQEPTTAAKDPQIERNRLWDQTQQLQAEGKLPEALAAAEAMLAIERKVLPAGHADLAVSLNWLAKLYVEREDFAAAKAARQESLDILQKLHGEAHWEVTDARRALEDVDRQAGMTRDQRQRRAEASRLNQEVVALGGAGKSREAFQSARRALALRTQGLDERHPDYAISLSNLAYLLKAQGDYAAARPLLEQALAIQKEVLGERHPDYARSLNNLALLLAAQGDYAAARPLLEQALAVRKEVLGERHPDYARSLNNLAMLLSSQGDYAAARPLFEQALAICKEVLGERHPDYTRSLNNLAMLLSSQGDYAAARPLLEQALAVRKEVLGERHPDYAISQNNLALLLAAQGDYAAARPLLEQALAICKEVFGERHPDYANSLTSLAALLAAQGDYAAARPLYEQALAVRKAALGERHPAYAQSLSNLGGILWSQQDYAGAAPLLEQAVAITRSNLDLASASQSERQQLAMTQALGGSLDAYLSLAPLARRPAVQAYRLVLTRKGAIFERQRRLHIQRGLLRADPQSEDAKRFATYQETVTRLATMALATPDPRQADAWRAQVKELTRRKDDLEAELARRNARFRAGKAEADRRPEQLQATLPRGTALVDLLVYTAFTPPDGSKGDFQQERRLVAFVVRRDRPIARIDLGPIAPIDRAIAAWRPVLRLEWPAPQDDDPARTLRRLAWEPLEPALEGIDSVLVAPDGSLGLVPLAALPGKEPGRYLIEERSIAVVPVPRLLGGGADAPGPREADPAQTPSLLLVGDVDYGGAPGAGGSTVASRSAAVDTRAGFAPQFERREGMRVEIAAIRDSFEEHFSDARPHILRGAKATEEAFRQQAEHARFLHLATHGYFAPPGLRSALGTSPARPGQGAIDTLGGAGVAGFHPGLLSGLALAGANLRPTPVGQDDGILTALEVAELDLSGVELAVLSACETGLGEVADGEGLLGLQRAFQVAGAHAVVASLWQVGDDSTRALMSRFYENFWRQGLPPRAALRAAQLDMLHGDLPRGVAGVRRDEASPTQKGRVPPFYWAAFVLSTDRP